MNTSNKEPKFKIGTRFRTRGKHPLDCVVTDILRTYNSAGELVRVRYVAERTFCGQAVEDIDVVETTIAMGLIT